SVGGAARIAAEHPGVHAMHDPTEGGLATGLHEVAFASGTGLRLHADRVPVLTEGKRLCEEYGLDPLGAIASGALLVMVEPTQADGLSEAYARAWIPCTHSGDLVPPDAGIYMLRAGERQRLPRYDADEITKVL
ncbi:MAG: hypothetical protein E3J25_11200, partial [Anaerolineales bacterium]